eukprot:811816-Karenia_brevis.AAC.1
MHLAGKFRTEVPNQSGGLSTPSPTAENGTTGSNGAGSSTDKVAEMQASTLKKLDDVAEKITKPAK